MVERERERESRTMVSGTNSGHFTHSPLPRNPLFLLARHVVYFIALLALLHQPPLHLGAVTAERARAACSSASHLFPLLLFPQFELNTIPRGLNIDCDSDL